MYKLALLPVAVMAAIFRSTNSNPFPMDTCNGFQLEEASIDDIQERLNSGQLTSRQLVQCYVDRVIQINPYLKAFIEINPDLYRIADNLDRERRNGKLRSPLHGIPILVKDNIATADKMNTTAGSYALQGSIVPRDAYVVSLLREAGAIIMGKGNMAEWAAIRSNNLSEGWSGRGGQTRNAYNLTQDPASSSSGCAHAVSANMVTIAIGTETDGSVVSPAQRAGIIGLKPTVGITSRSGVIPEPKSQCTIGVFGRTFKDTAYVLNVIQGIDKMDPITLKQMERVTKDYTKFVNTKSSLKNVRIGIPWKQIWQSPTTRNQLPQLFNAISQLRQAGAIIVNNTNLPNIDEISPKIPTLDWMFKNRLGLHNESEFTVNCYEFKRDLNQYLSELVYSPVRTLTEIIEFNLEHKEIEMQYFGQDILDYCDGNPFTEQVYTAAKTYTRKTTQQGIDAALSNHRLEALLVPSDTYSLSTQIPAQAGYPIVTIPAGIDPFGVPFGLSLWGTAYSEAAIIRIGSAIDDTLRRRRLPQFLEHTATNIPVNGEYGLYFN